MNGIHLSPVYWIDVLKTGITAIALLSRVHAVFAFLTVLKIGKILSILTK